jgi:drug/metabolite transporter (DMT)-like permease
VIRAPSELTIHLSIALLCVIWGSTWLVIRAGLRDLPPFTSAAVRFAVAALVMGAAAPALVPREGGARPSIALSLVTGTLNVGLSYGLVYWSETVLPSGLVSVLWSVFPMMMAVCAHRFLPGERLNGAQWLGFAVGFGGVAVLFATDLAAVGPGAVSAGLILLLSPAISAVGTSYIKLHGGGTSSVLLNRNGFAIGSGVLLLAALATERDAGARWSLAALGSVAYLALVGTVVAFGIYFWLLRYAPAYKLSLIAYVVPAIALTLGTLLGEEPLGWHTALGTGLVLAGVGAVYVGRRGSTETSSRAAPGPD